MNDDILPELLLAVEQQLVSPQTPYVAKAFKRLTALGLDENEAKTQIAIALGKEMESVMRKKRSFDESAYRELLDELPFAEEDDEEEDDLE
ncbi:hypothetical protein JIN85_04335 [Luteolibacter pohnpeiensis]|uniref:Uncharacterized protein n=1 Tax=Luteolibacter pohnpeiensis TaxID=454153 RepID=A0A934S3H3_9BACT|nr:hypothetical protein [Luteolibacter pohnpeiensis]MBK1881627.1 hypothetical protein [Luteolibacter pohnpeiensis]